MVKRSETGHLLNPRYALFGSMVLAGALSQRIRRARIAILGATLPILNPVRVAEEVAMLDNLLEGRLVAGGDPPRGAVLVEQHDG